MGIGVDASRTLLLFIIIHILFAYLMLLLCLRAPNQAGNLFKRTCTQVSYY